jgi:hypothetical protein
MPVNEKLMANLVKQYGPEQGKRIYYAMEQEGRTGRKPKSKVRPPSKPKVRKPR